MTFVGSDGHEHAFLAKPKDDLRKDSRLMEAAGVLNMLFAQVGITNTLCDNRDMNATCTMSRTHAGFLTCDDFLLMTIGPHDQRNTPLTQDPGSRRRGLHLRRFAVAPLTEECGLVEWVPNTSTFRNCCQEVYSAEGLFDHKYTNPKIKHMYDKFPVRRRMDHAYFSRCVQKQGRRVELLDQVLAGFPPRFHKWFLEHFTEPAAWLGARQRFTASAAVWSMVGHMLGRCI